MLPHAIQVRIRTNTPQMLKTLERLIAFPSVAVPHPESPEPYRKPCADALAFMLDAL